MWMHVLFHLSRFSHGLSALPPKLPVTEMFVHSVDGARLPDALFRKQQRQLDG